MYSNEIYIFDNINKIYVYPANHVYKMNKNDKTYHENQF